MGINSDKAEAAVQQNSKEALKIQKLNRKFELEDRASFEADKLLAIEELRSGGDIASQLLQTSGGRQADLINRTTGRSQDFLRRGRDRSIGALERGEGRAVGAIESGTQGALEQLNPALAGLSFGPQVFDSATVGGFGRNIQDILSGGALDPLIRERQGAATSALASAGLTRSNVAAEKAAELPAELAFGIEELLTGRATDRFQTGLDASGTAAGILEQQGVNLGNLFTGTSGGIADILNQTGINLSDVEGTGGINLANIAGNTGLNLANIAGGTSRGVANVQAGQPQSLTPFVQTENPLAIAQLEAQRNQNIVGLLSSGGLGGLGEGAGASGGSTGALVSILGALSDIRLKENIRPVSSIRDLTVYEWDWIEPALEADSNRAITGMNRGFIAQEVAVKHPEYVGEFAGLLTIDYGGLLKKLEVLH